jgi:hypothetical protein
MSSPVYSEHCNDCGKEVSDVVSIVGVHAIQARRTMQETLEAIRASLETLRADQIQLVQSQGNCRTSRTLLANQGELLARLANCRPSELSSR